MVCETGLKNETPHNFCRAPKEVYQNIAFDESDNKKYHISRFNLAGRAIFMKKRWFLFGARRILCEFLQSPAGFHVFFMRA